MADKTSKYLERNYNSCVISVHGRNWPFICEICDSSFTTKQGLENHFDHIHKKKKAYKCFNCDVYFLQKGDLNLHFRIVHEEKKTFNCSTCGARFRHRLTLVQFQKYTLLTTAI